MVLGLLFSGSAYADNYFNQCNFAGEQVNYSINFKY